jgi:hypothetical protein
MVLSVLGSSCVVQKDMNSVSSTYCMYCRVRIDSILVLLLYIRTVGSLRPVRTYLQTCGGCFVFAWSRGARPLHRTVLKCDVCTKLREGLELPTLHTQDIIGR